MFDVGQNRKNGSGWLKISANTHGFRAHSFTKYCAFSERTLIVLAGMLVGFPVLCFALNITGFSISIPGSPSAHTLSWLSGLVFAACGLVVWWGYNRASIEFLLTLNTQKKTLEVYAYDQQGTLVGHDHVPSDEINSVSLVDDEGTRRTKRTHTHSEFWLEVTTETKTYRLLCGREADIWPIYKKLRDSLPNVTA